MKSGVLCSAILLINRSVVGWLSRHLTVCRRKRQTRAGSSVANEVGADGVYTALAVGEYTPGSSIVLYWNNSLSLCGSPTNLTVTPQRRRGKSCIYYGCRVRVDRANHYCKSTTPSI